MREEGISWVERVAWMKDRRVREVQRESSGYEAKMWKGQDNLMQKACGG